MVSLITYLLPLFSITISHHSSYTEFNCFCTYSKIYTETLSLQRFKTRKEKSLNFRRGGGGGAKKRPPESKWHSFPVCYLSGGPWNIYHNQSRTPWTSWEQWRTVLRIKEVAFLVAQSREGERNLCLAPPLY